MRIALGVVLVTILALPCFQDVAEAQGPKENRRLRELEENIVGGAREPSAVLIFVPGIMGSELRDPRTGHVIWGEEGATLTGLRLEPESQPARAEEILKRFYTDIFGVMNIELRASIGAEVLSFPYDWRQDIEWLAEEFDRMIRGKWSDKLKGRRVIIIAHSMGGLVVWTWKNHFYRKDPNEFNLWRLILLGTPLEGACEMLRMLLTGYRPIPGASRVVESFYRVLFDDLLAAAYTFPSVFQLLPKDELEADQRTSCLVIDDMPASGRLAASHFSLPVWEDHIFPILRGSRVPDVADVPPVLSGEALWETLGVSIEEFKTRLSKMLEKGNKFRQSFELLETTLQSRVSYLYSSSHMTTEQVVISTDKKQVLREGMKADSGDGRVPERSAKNGNRHNTAPIALSASHGDLVKDKNFLKWLRNELTLSLRTERVRDHIVRLWTNEQGRDALLMSQFTVPFSTLGIDPMERPLDLRTRAIFDLNATVLREHVRAVRPELIGLPLGYQAFVFANYLRREKSLFSAALPFYELSLLSGELSEDETYEGLISYSEILLREKQYKQVLELFEGLPDSLHMKGRVRPYILNNWGVARWGIGEFEAARVLFQSAADSGLVIAERNLKLLEAQRQ